MYNRYIPQNDGTYRRSRIQEPAVVPPPPKVQTDPRPEPECSRECPRRPLPPRPKAPPRSIGSFWKQLVPQGLDTEDLLIVVLLLLMCGESGENRDWALLTLFLYLYL